jgi:hypothetical protein
MSKYAEFNSATAGVNQDDNTTEYEGCGDMQILIVYTGWPKSFKDADDPNATLMFEMMCAASDAAKKVFKKATEAPK